MNKKFIILFLLIFSIGWFSSSVYSNNQQPEKQSLDKNSELLEQFEQLEQRIFSEKPEEREKISPHDWIKTKDIYVYEDRVIIKIDKPEWAIFTDTNSMDPVLDSTANALEIIPQSEKDIHVGDIVAYESKYKDGIITHRVVEIGYDNSGWYARLKGDNNDSRDPGKIRFSQIKRVVVAIIY